MARVAARLARSVQGLQYQEFSVQRSLLNGSGREAGVLRPGNGQRRRFDAPSSLGGSGTEGLRIGRDGCPGSDDDDDGGERCWRDGVRPGGTWWELGKSGTG